MFPTRSPLPANPLRWLGLLGWFWLLGWLALGAPPQPAAGKTGLRPVLLSTLPQPDEARPPLVSELTTDEPEIRNDTRSEAERDRVQALALAAHGRLLFQRQEFAAALRRYQRAWRYDPRAVNLLREVVPLAFGLNRPDEATRYAILAAEAQTTDAQLLTQLGDYLTTQHELARAAGLYARALEQLPAGDALASALLHLKLGSLHLAQGQFDQAAARFDVARQTYDQPEQAGLTDNQIEQLRERIVPAWPLMAEAALQSGEFARAEELFARAGRTNQNPGWLAFQRARIAARRQNWDEALRQVDDYWQHAQPPVAGAAAYELLAEVLRQTQPDGEAARREARQRLAERLERRPDEVEAADFLGRLWREDKQPQQARQVYAEALEKSPGDLRLLAGLAATLLEADNAGDALPALGRLVHASDGSLAGLGEPLERLIADPPRVRQLLDLAGRQLDQQQLAEGAALAVAQIAVQARQWEAAEKFFQQAASEPRPGKLEVLTVWGLSMFLAEQHARAAAALRLAIREDAAGDRAAELYHYQSSALALNDQTDDAVRAARRAAALEPDSAEFLSRIPLIYYQAGRDREAEQAYRELLDRFDGDADSPTRDVLREARLVLSHLCVRGDRYDEGVEWLEQVLDEFPEDAGARNDLGYLWADRGEHLERALRMTRAAVAADPENKAYRDSLGWALYRLGKHAEALDELKLAAGEGAAAEEASQQDGGVDGVVLDHLGDAYWQLGQHAQAQAAWRRALEALRSQTTPADNTLRQAIEAKLRRPAN